MPYMDKLSTYKTTAVCTNGRISVIYSETEIVTRDSDKPDAIITLRTGGWHSVTTKRKMNQASNQFGLGYRVVQRKGNWFVCFMDCRPELAFDADEISFPRHGV